MNPVLKKLYLEKQEFVTADLLRTYCKSFNVDYDSTIRNLSYRGHLVRIFRGVFYVRNLEEHNLGKTKYSHFELVAKGLALKNITEWYFGLHTALKLNNMTHEEYVIDHVFNDMLFRAHPINILGYKFHFHKIAPSLLTFGIVKKDPIQYSDPEKTILDFLYIWRYNSVPKERIIMDVAEYTRDISKEKMKQYVKYYPKTVETILEEII